MDGTVLLADDDAAVRKVLSRALTGAGCRVHATSLLTTLARWSAEGRGDLIITDVAMPDGNGIEQLQELRKLRPELPVIVISAQNTIMTAIQAQEAEAFCYLPKPFDLPDLLGRVGDALRRRRPAPEKHMQPEDELPLVGRAPVMQSLYQSLAKVMNADLPLHLRGETGTGKSLVAQIVHECSDRRGLPMITVSPHRLEDPDTAEGLFARAGGGTVILDEVADLSDSGQRILARQLDRPDSRARIVSCSQKDLSAAMATGEFRRDLFFRLSGAVIEVPALRRRLVDVPLLANSFLRRIEGPGGRPRFTGGDPPKPVKTYRWPGNVRELRHAVEQASLTTNRDEIGWNDIAGSLHLEHAGLRSGSDPAVSAFGDRVRKDIEVFLAAHGQETPPHGLYARVIREVEAPLIAAALESTGGNREKCSELLGINRNTLRKKIRELGIWNKSISYEGRPR